jgi:hypothetical protein
MGRVCVAFGKSQSDRRGVHDMAYAGTGNDLAAAVFDRDATRTVQNKSQAPYGGMKNSGYGRFDGRAVIDEFTELKWVTIEPPDQPYPV